MPDIVTNMLYQDIDRLQEKVKELEAENDELRAERGRLREQVNATIELLECAKINVDNIKIGGVIFCDFTKMQIDEAIKNLAQALAGKKNEN